MTTTESPPLVTPTTGAPPAKSHVPLPFGAKICPILSVAPLPPPSQLAMATLSASKPEREAEVCVGPRCMFWVTTHTDDQGRPVGGACAIALMPIALFEVKAALSAANQGD